MTVTPRVCIIFLIIQRTEVNYSAFTTVATPQDIDQMIAIFQGIQNRQSRANNISAYVNVCANRRDGAGEMEYVLSIHKA